MSWSAGRTLPGALYKNSVLVGQCFAPAVAAEIVAQMNSMEVERWKCDAEEQAKKYQEMESSLTAEALRLREENEELKRKLEDSGLDPEFRGASIPQRFKEDGF